MQRRWGQFTDDAECDISFSLGCDVPLAQLDGGPQHHSVKALQVFQLSQGAGGAQQGLAVTCGTETQQEK